MHQEIHEETYWKETECKLLEFPSDCMLTVRSAGHYRHTRETWSYVVRARPIYQLFWIVEGKASFGMNGKEYIFGEGTVPVYYPDEPHIINVVSDIFECYWLTVEGTLVDTIFRGFHFYPMPRYIGKCPAYLFDELIEQIKDISPYGLAAAASTAYNIMALAKAGIPDSRQLEHYVTQAVKLINQNFREHDFNVNCIADTLMINRSVLSRIFHRIMGMSVIDYLMLTKHVNALDLLRQTDFPIEKVGSLSGFHNPVSFIRAFKKRQKMTPSAYRKSGSNS